MEQPGVARLGLAWSGVARLGLARQAVAGSGTVRQGKGPNGMKGLKMKIGKPFDADPMITSAVEAVMKVIGERGSVLLWSTIESATGCERNVGSWWTIVNKVRRRLRDERMQATWPERDVGLRLLTHKETATEIPKLRQRKMFRQAGRALKEMETADPNKLNMTDRRLLASQIERLMAERRSLRAAQKELLEATQTLPRRTGGASHSVQGIAR